LAGWKRGSDGSFKECLVWNAWLEARVVGGLRSERVRSEAREVIQDAWLERSEEKAS
jgi:hypothetical protein